MLPGGIKKILNHSNNERTERNKHFNQRPGRVQGRGKNTGKHEFTIDFTTVKKLPLKYKSEFAPDFFFLVIGPWNYEPVSKAMGDMLLYFGSNVQEI